MSDIYVKLRERLDMFPQGFPKTESGVELEILEHLFSEDEALLSLNLRPFPEPVSAIAERTGDDENALSEILYDMSKRGLILRFSESEESRFYWLAPWMVGIWEFQLNNLSKENIPLYERFYEEGMVPAAKNKKTPGFRVIPIEEEISHLDEIQPFEQISKLIGAQDKFAVAPCICRKEARMTDKGCNKLLESCMMFGVAAEYYLENGFAREINKEEALEILKKAEDDGLIHFSSNHTDSKIFICNCCECCCKALAHVVKYGNLNAVASSNYLAVQNKDECTDCEECVDRCQVNAILTESGQTTIESERCIGCGLCVTTCPTEAISMIAKSPEKISPIFQNGDELLLIQAKEQNKIFPFE